MELELGNWELVTTSSVCRPLFSPNLLRADPQPQTYKTISSSVTPTSANLQKPQKLFGKTTTSVAPSLPTLLLLPTLSSHSWRLIPGSICCWYPVILYPGSRKTRLCCLCVCLREREEKGRAWSLAMATPDGGGNQQAERGAAAAGEGAGGRGSVGSAGQSDEYPHCCQPLRDGVQGAQHAVLTTPW